MNLSEEYLRGLIEGEGCFTFCSVPVYHPVLNKKLKVPAFALRMHKRDEELIAAVKDKLGLKNRLYQAKPVGLEVKGKIYRRGGQTILIVRDFGQLKNKIIPFFYKKLLGNKGKQFEAWLNKIGEDPLVQDSYKLLHRLHKSGYWDVGISEQKIV